jgi:parvulin-like peptidyl-prolyl isomerase
MLLFARCLVILLAAWVFAGCSWADRVRGFIQGEDRQTSALTVGEKVFSKDDLSRFFDSRLSDFREPSEADHVKSNLLDSFIEEKLLLHQAERLNVQPNAQTLQSMLEKISTAGAERQGPAVLRDAELERNLAESLKVQQYLHDHLLTAVSVGEEECERYYEQHLTDYIRNDVVRIREILVDDKTLAEKIVLTLKTHRNQNFGDLARMYSKAPSASDGGDLGRFERGDLPEEFEKVLFSLAPGSASKIVNTKYGYHIFLVEERILAHQQKFYEVKEQILEKLSLEKEREIIKRELQLLVNQIPVRIHRDNLDFNYVNARFSDTGGNRP